METLNFKIGLSGTFFNNVPAYSILLNGVKHASGKVSDSTEIIEFTVDLAEDSTHVLEVRLDNKRNIDTITDANGAILKDMLLNIDNIEIDDIELGILKWTHSKFVGDDSTRPVLTNCVNLGWNGSWQLAFDTPYYIWLLENM